MGGGSCACYGGPNQLNLSLLLILFCMQVTSMIHFNQGEVLLRWDQQIQQICTKVNTIIDDMAKLPPPPMQAS